MGLDWQDVQPPLPTKTTKGDPREAAPIQVEFIGAEWVASREKMIEYETGILRMNAFEQRAAQQASAAGVGG